MTGRVWAVGGLAAGVLVMPLVLIGLLAPRPSPCRSSRRLPPAATGC